MSVVYSSRQLYVNPDSMGYTDVMLGDEGCWEWCPLLIGVESREKIVEFCSPEHQLGMIAGEDWYPSSALNGNKPTKKIEKFIL